jgi:hypothetical protein
MHANVVGASLASFLIRTGVYVDFGLILVAGHIDLNNSSTAARRRVPPSLSKPFMPSLR